jgi:hypothetical protein
MNALVVRRALLWITLALAATATATATAGASTANAAGTTSLKKVNLMSSLWTFEAVAQQLLHCKPTLAGISAALGGPVAPPSRDISFALNGLPFLAVNISEFREDLDLVFDIAPDRKRLADIVAEPEAWKAGPRLPDSGVREMSRTWLGGARSVTCIVRLEGEGPIASLRVTGQARCQVSRH